MDRVPILRRSFQNREAIRGEKGDLKGEIVEEIKLT
jgi:hypothetical protein